MKQSASQDSLKGSHSSMQSSIANRVLNIQCSMGNDQDTELNMQEIILEPSPRLT